MMQTRLRIAPKEQLKEKRKKVRAVIVVRDTPSQPHLLSYQIVSKTLKGYRNSGAHKIGS